MPKLQPVHGLAQIIHFSAYFAESVGNLEYWRLKFCTQVNAIINLYLHLKLKL